MMLGALCGCRPPQRPTSCPARTPATPERSAAMSSREACASTPGPGIQAFGVMPPEGVDSDCVWIEPALGVRMFWVDSLDSGAPGAEAPPRNDRSGLGGGWFWIPGPLPRPFSRCARPRGPRYPGMTDRVVVAVWRGGYRKVNVLVNLAPEGRSVLFSASPCGPLVDGDVDLPVGGRSAAFQCCVLA